MQLRSEHLRLSCRWSACSTFVTPRYSISADTNVALKSLGTTNIGIRPFSAPQHFRQCLPGVPGRGSPRTARQHDALSTEAIFSEVSDAFSDREWPHREHPQAGALRNLLLPLRRVPLGGYGNAVSMITATLVAPTFTGCESPCRSPPPRGRVSGGARDARADHHFRKAGELEVWRHRHRIVEREIER